MLRGKNKKSSRLGLWFRLKPEFSSWARILGGLFTVLMLIVALFLGIRAVYAYLDIIRFTGLDTSSSDTCPLIQSISGSTDKEDVCTGLRWKEADEAGGPFTWAEATVKCTDNYRLPTIDELYSLINTKNGASPLIVPPTSGSSLEMGAYWSGTEYEPNKNYARSVNFRGGTADNVIFSKSYPLRVRCVSKQFCGNGTRETGEECDGSDFGTETGKQILTCKDKGHLGGILGCIACDLNENNCFDRVTRPTNPGQSCSAVCGNLRQKSDGRICNWGEADCSGATLSCKSIGTYQGYCSTTLTKSCNADGDCPTGETCKTGGTALLNGKWKKYMPREIGGTNYWVCEDMDTPAADCSTVMAGYGDPCLGRKVPWTYCQCGL